MAYEINSIDLASFGIVEAHASGGNIALSGCFNFPARIGDVSHEWGDEDGIQIYTEEQDLFYGGRDILFQANIFGDRVTIKNAINDFTDTATAVTGAYPFETPYGTFNVYLKDLKTDHYPDACIIKATFREPVVDLTGGSLPSTASDPYTIDGIPFSSFGLYIDRIKAIYDFPEMKNMSVTAWEYEGMSNEFRKVNTWNFNAWLIANNLEDFIQDVKNLYSLFDQAGERSINLNGSQVIFTGVPLTGFTINDVRMFGATLVIGSFKCPFTITSQT
jgi:hypothetical protein